MGKVVSTKHTITQYNGFGANCVVNDVVGEYVIWATMTGSYGEKIHRIVGGSYWDIGKCLKKALKYHEGGQYTDIEVQHLQQKWRIDFADILAQHIRDNTPVARSN